MAESDRRTQSELESERLNEERTIRERSGTSGKGERDRAVSGGMTRREEERRREERRRRDPGAWPYTGMTGSGYRSPGYLGYPGYMSYPWSRFSHGMDPSYEDWQGPGFGTQSPGSWEPRVETYEREESMVVRLELPGWDKDEVTVAVEDDELVVEGMREEDGELEEDRRERDFQSGSRRYQAERFCTRVPLPAAVEASDVKAKFKNGILEVRIPVPERETERRTVKIDT